MKRLKICLTLAKEKFNKLAEEVEYSNEDDFRTKVKTIKESYFGKKEVKQNDEIDNVAAGESSNEDLSNKWFALLLLVKQKTLNCLTNNNTGENRYVLI